MESPAYFDFSSEGSKDCYFFLQVFPNLSTLIIENFEVITWFPHPHDAPITELRILDKIEVPLSWRDEYVPAFERITSHLTQLHTLVLGAEPDRDHHSYWYKPSIKQTYVGKPGHVELVLNAVLKNCTSLQRVVFSYRILDTDGMNAIYDCLVLRHTEGGDSEPDNMFTGKISFRNCTLHRRSYDEELPDLDELDLEGYRQVLADYCSGDIDQDDGLPLSTGYICPMEHYWP